MEVRNGMTPRLISSISSIRYLILKSQYYVEPNAAVGTWECGRKGIRN